MRLLQHQNAIPRLVRHQPRPTPPKVRFGPKADISIHMDCPPMPLYSIASSRKASRKALPVGPLGRAVMNWMLSGTL